MPKYTHDKWRSSHDFLINHQFGERRTIFVLIITFITMVVEIVSGIIYGSMALLADGWHMATHVLAFAITLFAYWYAKKNKESDQFTFSTGKVGTLGGFASAVALGTVALMMVIESLERFFAPEEIQFNSAIIVAVIGFVVNGISVFALQGSGHSHSHDHHGHEHSHEHGHQQDHNLKAAYFHVLADTLTSLLAIGALLIGKYLGWVWIDPLMGIVGAIIITKWAFGLIKESSTILLDSEADLDLKEKVISLIEADKDSRVVDIHTWYVSPKHIVVVLSIVTHYPEEPDYYKKLVEQVIPCDHITIEVNRCDDPACIPVNK